MATRPSIPIEPSDSLQLAADRLVLQAYAPAAVIFNAAGDIVYIRGGTGKYLEAAALRSMTIVVFREVAMSARRGKRKGEITPEAPREQELQRYRDEIMNPSEEACATREELQSSNDELQSTNEELQSANEELTASG